MDRYQTIEGECEHRIEINRSIFICNIKGISNFDDGVHFIKKTTKKYSNATHNCYALVTIDDKQKFFDDGEPSGTAGQPILQAIKNHNLNNTVAVVTRYFGGVKLGTAGLVNAYGTSVNEAISICNILTMLLCREGVVDIDYSELTMLNRATECKVLDTQYMSSVQLTLACPIEIVDKTENLIAEITNGRSKIAWGTEGYYNFP